jgi:hypothetical protein
MVDLSLPMERTSWPAPIHLPALPAMTAWATLNRTIRMLLRNGSYEANCLQLYLPQVTNWALMQLCDVPATLKCGLGPNSINIPVDFHSPNSLSSKLDRGLITFDIPCPMSAQILCELENVAEIKTQLYCHSKLEFSPEGSTRRNGKRPVEPSQSRFLNIIIFGRECLEEKVGEYLSKRKMYLQDPLGCERRVPYRNPYVIQPISSESVMTDSFLFLC